MIRHLAGLAEIVDDVNAAAAFYRDVLGLKVNAEPGAEYGTVEVATILHFGLWSRAAAAERTLGDASRANEIPLGITIGFEVDAVPDAERTIAAGGWPIVQAAQTEPWGQVTCRLRSPSGALVEVSETPWARRVAQPLVAEHPPK